MHYFDGDDDDDTTQDEQGDAQTGDYNLGDDIGEKIGEDSQSDDMAV